MRIITVNLPVSFLKMIDGLTGEFALYPSRSELIRVAVRDFLINELQAAKNFTNFQEKSITQITPKVEKATEEVDPNLFVQIPEYKTFRLVKK